jgi:hypothetical protein
VTRLRDVKRRLYRTVRRSAPRRQKLLEMIPHGGMCAEVGVWRGDFSARILELARPSQLHLIDPWRAFDDDTYEGAWYGGQLEQGQADMDAVYQGVVDRFAEQRARGIVRVHRMMSTEAAATFSDSFFDFVYIDGNHTYEFVLADLQAFAPKVRPGGLLAGDDYGVQGWWGDGVTRAVDEFVRSGAATVVMLEQSQFVLHPAELSLPQA